MRGNIYKVIGSSLVFTAATLVAEEQGDKPGDTQPTPAATQHQLLDTTILRQGAVQDLQGNAIGKVERFLVDAISGEIRYVVLQVNKDWSLNDPEVILPWKKLQISKTPEHRFTVTLDADHEKLANAPKFDPALVAQLTTTASAQPIFAYWGMQWTNPDSPTGQSAPTADESAKTTSAPSTSTPPVSTAGASATPDHTGKGADIGVRSGPSTSTSSPTGTPNPSGTSGTPDSTPVTELPDSGQPSPDRPPILNVDDNPTPQD